MAAKHEPLESSNKTTQVLLEHVPMGARPKFLRDLIQSCEPSDLASISFVTTLLLQSEDSEAEQGLLVFLEKAIQSGHVECAVAASLQHHKLGAQLFARVAESVASADGQVDQPLLSYLRFSRSVIFHTSSIDASSIMLRSCLRLLRYATPQISTAARDVIFAIFGVQEASFAKDVVRSAQTLIWSTVTELASLESNKAHRILGYSLWLRWILSVGGEHLQTLATDEYWALILYGLRRGDSEQRKLCLSIIKLSAAPGIPGCSQQVSAQYERYCTVFETIVLGRYINQIQECERDLDFLATQSLLSPAWLFTLLASALDNTMQDSNRKFIGNWVLRAEFRSSVDSPEFADFFEHDFVPWAIQGQLFVSTLKQKKGLLRCVHGDRLADFISKLLQNPNRPNELVDIVVNAIHRKRNTIFAYALVYLLQGLQGQLQSDQKTKISDQISRLPEVARDYVSLQVSGITASSQLKTTQSRREILEQEALEKCRSFVPSLQSLEDIWSDLDYLEYPKRLLMMIPDVICHPQLVQAAMDDSTLADSLRQKLSTLQTTAETKSFLFPPLAFSVRSTILPQPQALEIFDIADFIVWIAEHPPAANIDLMLEEAEIPLTGLSYEHYFGSRPSYGFAAYFDIVSRLRLHQNLVKKVLEHVLSRWQSQKLPPPTVSVWKTTLQLQVLLLCFEQYEFGSVADVHTTMETLFHILSIEPLPRYRYLLEWILVRMFTKHNLHSSLLARLGTRDHHSNPKHLASLMKIGVTLACSGHQDSQSEEDFATQLATAFVPLAASSKVVIRHEAQWQVPVLMDHARAKDWESITKNPALVALDDYIRSLERFYEPPVERVLGKFDLETDHNMTNLVEGQWFELDHTEASVTSRDDFVKVRGSDASGDVMPESCMPLGEAIVRSPPPSSLSDESPPNEKASLGPQTLLQVQTALQTKGQAYLSRALTTNPTATSSFNPTNTTTTNNATNNLIVVGSLVDNPHNLGGLSRVSEVFGCSALTLQNQNVLSNKDFSAVSVSSHQHIPIIQLSATDIPDFLTERKREGWTVVGIEQTDRSLTLGSEAAERVFGDVDGGKIVLVVGSEKEGIPGVVLTECEILVEIPQVGVTRSLNVQTAVACVLFEVQRQRQRMKEREK